MSPRIPIRLLAVQSDERLSRLVREGHERAFDALVHRYRRPLLRYCRGLGLPAARAEDVVQLALLNAWLALSGGTEVRELRPWLYRIAHNTALNALRGASEHNVELREPVGVSASHAGEAELEQRIAVCDALADVAALPAMQRQAILLTAIEGKTHGEVAGLLGVKQDAVRGLLYRARSTLRGTAAALTPQPLLSWAASGAGGAGSAAERLSEVPAGGALGLTGAVLKGVAVALTAGAIVGGASVVRLHGNHPRSSRAPATATPGAGRESIAAQVSSAPASRVYLADAEGTHVSVAGGRAPRRYHGSAVGRSRTDTRAPRGADEAPAAGVGLEAGSDAVQAPASGPQKPAGQGGEHESGGGGAEDHAAGSSASSARSEEGFSGVSQSVAAPVGDGQATHPGDTRQERHRAPEAESEASAPAGQAPAGGSEH
jgi:RNA polymerase sigma factor (sigma-70 family)